MDRNRTTPANALPERRAWRREAVPSFPGFESPWKPARGRDDSHDVRAIGPFQRRPAALARRDGGPDLFPKESSARSWRGAAESNGACRDLASVGIAAASNSEPQELAIRNHTREVVRKSATQGVENRSEFEFRIRDTRARSVMVYKLTWTV